MKKTKKTITKTIKKTVGVGLLIALGFAAGFPIGNIIGFARGSEWALVQADILARESGLHMPVCLNDGDFCVIMKQPRGLYKRAAEWADEDEQEGIPEQNRTTEQDNKTFAYAVHTKTGPAEQTVSVVRQ